MWALIPLKDFTEAKQRLSGVLTPAERRKLFHAMVQDVLDVLMAEPALEGVVLVSDDPAAALLAEHHGARHWSERELGATGLNRVVAAAVARVAAQGVDTVMVVHGDLPLLSADELGELIDRHRSGGAKTVTVATDRRGDGSNIVLCTPPDVLEFAYGAQSCRKHRDNAARAGVLYRVSELPGASRDIDAAADLFELLDSRWQGRAAHTMTCLQHSGIAQRLKAMAAGEANADYHTREAE